jgi:L-lysine 6-transaminase
VVDPAQVHEIVGRHRLADGYEFVLDLERSRGSRLVDARDGTEYLDMFGFFASSPLGLNPPQLVDDGDFMATLARVAANKPSNGDVYTTHFAEFITTFERVLGDPDLPHLFVIDGGALAIENALKAAFDWKQQHNEANGRSGELGTQVLHLTQAFHGRSGYTMSLTNTEPVKTARFPKFDWPRIDSPAMRFPLEAHLVEVEAAEERALEQAREAFAERGHDIACFIAEPIQAEGGDNHLRGKFLRAVQELCLEHDALFILDEVQTGGGATGTPWCYQQLDLEPDLVAFGKKTQVCGVMGGRRIGEVEGNVFATSSRIDSTWNGNLADMVRSRRIWEVVEEEELIPRAATLGKLLTEELGAVADHNPDLVSNVRGRGLLAAFDLPSREQRDAFVLRMRHDERVIMLPCGPRSVRFRPHLAVSEAELGEACDAADRVLAAMAG